MQFFKKILNKERFFLPLVVFLFSLLRIPSLVEPYWYGDEGIYEVIGMALSAGRTLYSGIWDNKPPMLYVLYGIFNGDQFQLRLLSLLFGAAAVIVFYFLAKKIFSRKGVILGTTALFAFLFGIPLLEGNIANSENFMLFPIILAMYLIIASNEKLNYKNYAVAGMLLSFAFLLKFVALFDFAAAVLISLILNYYDASFKKIFSLKRFVTLFKKELILTVAFVAPIVITIVYFMFVGAFADFFKAAFSQNIGYVAHGNNFFITNGLLYLKLVLLALSVIVIFRFKNLLGKTGVFIMVWLVLSLYNAFFSERPYTHYLLVILPALCLLAGFIFENKRMQRITAVIFVLVFFLLFQNFNTYRKIIPYYVNYLSFIVNGKTADEYQSFFDRNTPRDYAIARFISMNTKEDDNIFVWGDAGQIYALSGKLPPGRYVVAYHMTFYKNAIEETKKDIQKARPKYIIQTKEDANLLNILDTYSPKYMIGNAKIYERQY